MMDGTTELRHLPPLERRHLVQLLDFGDSWRILASYIPKPASASGAGPWLITSTHMRILDDLKHHPSATTSTSPSNALVEFWATCGKKSERPTLIAVVEILLKCKLQRIASYIGSLIGMVLNEEDEGNCVPFLPPFPGGGNNLDLNKSSVNSVYQASSSSSMASASPGVSLPLVLPSPSDSNHHRPNLPWSGEHSLNLIQLTLGEDEDTTSSNASASASTTFKSNFTSDFNDAISKAGNSIGHQESYIADSLTSSSHQSTLSPFAEKEGDLACICSKLAKLGLNMSTLDTAIIPYTKLHQLTNAFAPVPLDSGGHMIGAGAYGTVFKVILTQQELHWHNLMLNHENCSTGSGTGCAGHSGKQESHGEQNSSSKTTVSASLASSNLSTELAKSPVTVAVKVLAEDVDTKQFINEVTVLTKFKHENLLPFLGISIDGPRLCLLYQFMPLGSLTRALDRNCLRRENTILSPPSSPPPGDNLPVVVNNPLSGNKCTSPSDANLGDVSSSKDKLPVNDRENLFKIEQNHQLHLEKEKNEQANSHPHHLSPNLLPSVCDRLKIALGTAKGLTYLHTFDVVSYVHRDVKSDNILLGYNFTPKLGDFGLTRIGSTASSTSSSTTLSTQTSLVTQNVIGTTVYMAPEAFRGDISTKLDSFAYGIVLLELLTGLPAFDSTREEVDILCHVEEALEDWDSQSETTVQTISQESLEAMKKLLDDRIDWNSEQKLNLAIGLFRISKLATEQKKKNRLSMVKVQQELEKLIQFTGIGQSIVDT